MGEKRYIRRYIQLAQNGLCNTISDLVVGIVIVCDGKIIGRGYYIRYGEVCAEVNAIRSVKEPLLLKHSTVYVSLEPCAHYGKTPSCADLIIEKQIPRTIIGCQDSFAKVAGWGTQRSEDAGRKAIVGMLGEDRKDLIRRFATFHPLHRPYITLKWVEPTDKHIDKCRKDGKPVILSTPLTSIPVHGRRTEHSMIMVDTYTVELDNPSLTICNWRSQSPIRIVIDRQ